MNHLLESRLDALRSTLDELWQAFDENLQILLINLTGDTTMPRSQPKELNPLAKTVREKCLDFMIREHPLAADLKFAMAVLRVGQDYERMHEISTTLNRRVEYLRNTNFQDICREMTGVLADILNMNKLAQGVWRRDHRESIEHIRAEMRKLSEHVLPAIAKIQTRILESIPLANGNAEAYVETVLACRHLKRVASLMATVPEEMVSFS
jgi:phosphate uptake regulator